MAARWPDGPEPGTESSEMASKCLWALLYAVAAAFVLTCSSGWYLDWYRMSPF